MENRFSFGCHKLTQKMKRSLLYFLLVLPALSFAQSNFQKGYLVSNSMDTLKGYVNYKERTFNPASVGFKPALDAKAAVFTVSNAAGYGVNNETSFERFFIRISSSSGNIANLKAGKDTSSIKDTVFLKVLLKGKNVNLYQYTDVIKTRFYLLEHGKASPYELVKNFYLDSLGHGDLTVEDIYVSQLRKVMIKLNAGTENDVKVLEKLNYTESDLTKMVSLINGEQKMKPKVANTRFFVGLGITGSTAYYTGDDLLANDDAKEKHSFLPSLKVGVDFFANPAIGKLLGRIELDFMMNKSKISATSDQAAFAALSHSFDQYTVAFSPQVIYNFYNTNAVKVFVGAGLSVNLSMYSNNKTTRYNSISQINNVNEYQIKLDALNMALPFTLGMVLNRKIEISGTYITPAQLSSYQEFNVEVQRYQLGVAYLFAKH